MKTKVWVTPVALGVALLVSVGGCRSNDMEDAADSVGDASRHAGEQVESKTRDAADAVKDVAEDVAD